MTEKEFLKRVHAPSPDGRVAYLSDRMIEVAKEAGATFDPEPIEPVEIWRSPEIPARRLMFRPNAQETPKVPGVEFDGWRQTNRPSGTYRWESKGMTGDWGWCGNDILMAELARRLLAEACLAAGLKRGGEA